MIASFVVLSMKTKFNLLLALFTISLVFSKSHAQHQISIQTGALNYYFDKVPFGWNATSSYIPNYALGLQYQFQKPNNKLIAAQINFIRDRHYWNIESPGNLDFSNRSIQEMNVTFSNQKELSKKVNWTYGAGPTVRNQYLFTNTIDSSPLSYISNSIQFGLKGQTSLTYTPIKWLTIYGQINLSGYLISKPINRYYNSDFISDFGYKKPNFLPSRLHSSLTFGVGINF